MMIDHVAEQRCETKKWRSKHPVVLEQSHSLFFKAFRYMTLYILNISRIICL